MYVNLYYKFKFNLLNRLINVFKLNVLSTDCFYFFNKSLTNLIRLK
jgi:hypothetical protein